MTPVPVREKEKPSAKPSSVDTAMAETAEASGASVDKIREILFGSQIKNYETRFARLEDALSRETAEIKDTMRRRLDSLESFFKSETESLAARLKTERDEREETLNAISRELKANTAQLSKKILDLDNQGAQDKSAGRQELMAESRKLLDEIRQRNESLSSLLENRVQELRNAKTDRSALAALFVELAVRLKDEGENGKDGPSRCGAPPRDEASMGSTPADLKRDPEFDPSHDELAELRALLLGQQIVELQALQKRLDDPSLRAEETQPDPGVGHGARPASRSAPAARVPPHRRASAANLRHPQPPHSSPPHLRPSSATRCARPWPTPSAPWPIPSTSPCSAASPGRA